MSSLAVINQKDISTLEIDDNLKRFVRTWLGRLAGGKPRKETVKTYFMHIGQWFLWCRTVSDVHPFDIKEEDLLQFRDHLVNSGGRQENGEQQPALHNTIALKLSVIRSFYNAAHRRGLISVDPAAEVKAPRDENGESDIVFLTAGEAELLLRQVAKAEVLKALRDQAIIALLLLEGLRRCEIVRLDYQCMSESMDGGVRLKIRGKGKTAYIYPREDTLGALRAYFNALGEPSHDADGQPAFIRVKKGGVSGGKRLTEQGVNYIVDGYLRRAGLKKPHGSCHQLRHTAGSLIYMATKDVKAVQLSLRHSTLEMAAHYSQIVERGRKRFTSQIPLSL
jgi:integrase/recombinase XerC/integrase/recombinase XerD